MKIFKTVSKYQIVKKKRLNIIQNNYELSFKKENVPCASVLLD